MRETAVVDDRFGNAGYDLNNPEIDKIIARWKLDVQNMMQCSEEDRFRFFGLLAAQASPQEMQFIGTGQGRNTWLGD